MKIVKQRMSTIKVGRGFEVYHQGTDQIFNAMVYKSIDEESNVEYKLKYKCPSEVGVPELKKILLSVENNLDEEDLENVNEILDLEGFSFIKFK